MKAFSEWLDSYNYNSSICFSSSRAENVYVAFCSNFTPLTENGFFSHNHVKTNHLVDTLNFHVVDISIYDLPHESLRIAKQVCVRC